MYVYNYMYNVLYMYILKSTRSAKADARTELDFDFPVKLEIEIAKSDARTRFFGSTRKIKPSYELEAGFPARFPVKIELLETGELGSRFPSSIS